MFDYGTTRFVFCVGCLAFKFARVRLIDAFQRAQKSSKPFDLQRILTILQFLGRGLEANIEEYRFYHKYSELQLAPTYFSLFGFVNIQARGSDICEGDLPICPFRKLAERNIDLQKSENFVCVKGVPRLADYGNKNLNLLLAEHAESFQVVYEY